MTPPVLLSSCIAFSTRASSATVQYAVSDACDIHSSPFLNYSYVLLVRSTHSASDVLSYRNAALASPRYSDSRT